MASTYHENVDLRNASDFSLNGANAIYSLLGKLLTGSQRLGRIANKSDAEFAGDMDKYLATLTISNVRNLQELVDWNIEHASEALPPGKSDSNLHQYYLFLTQVQSIPVKTNYSKASNPIFHLKSSKAFASISSRLAQASMLRSANMELISSSRLVIAFSLSTQQRKVISLPHKSTSFLLTLIGYPVIALPLAYLDYNGRPVGLTAMAAAHQEPLLLKFASAFESSFPPREPPSAFIDGVKGMHVSSGVL